MPAKRRLPASFLVGALSGASALADQRPNVTACGPVDPAPSGWSCIPSFGRDSWIGTYHDTQSGAFVRFYTGDPEKWSCATEAIVRGRDSHGVMRRSFRAPKARDCQLQKWADRGFDELPRSLEEALPPPEAAALVSVFEFPERSPVNLIGYACTGDQERRIVQLFAHGVNPRVIGDSGEPATVSRGWADSLQPGVELQSVLARAGIQLLVHISACDGLKLIYPIRSADQEVVLTFDRSLRLVDKTIRSRE
jgi:hypothetical protein